ncbi:TBC1 domain family member 1 isoform X3 [Gadus chalcogrammus]|uniref:TBC1 domain family member 1 isoform X3 n=1 Tax=Gadus chalcogrammus TaxID=1042646 RepID=UPI0024C362E8|nr:TBC1 domain family member 1 isoform X3 [Gadus chalcogrammus]
MEGICFEVKPTRDEALVPHCVQKPPSKRRSLPSIAPPTVVTSRLDKGRRSYPRARGETKEVLAEKEEEQEMRYRLALVGSLPVHPLTTMAMLPWVVAQIVRPGPGEREWGRGGPHVGGHQNPPKRNQSVFLTVSASRVQCVSAWAEGAAWDPLSHTVLFECLPHRVTKLIYNSQEPSSFGCLIRDGQHCACYVFQCHDSTRVPEIISTLRQAGKSAARTDDVTPTPDASPPTASRGLAIAQSCPSFSSISATTTTAAGTTTMTTSSLSAPQLSPTAFAKKFEVLFCGRVTVAHKKAPPALIDECIEKFSQSRGSGGGAKGSGGGGLAGGLKRALSFHSNGSLSDGGGDGLAESPTAPRRPLLYKRDPSFPCLQALDENGLSPEITLSHADDAHCHSTGVRPTSLQENRTMLFMVGRSQIFLVSPDTKKVAIEKSFREISFCSQGIHHVDHFGFICRETVDGASCHFVCYVFQCTDESLFPLCPPQVDEIMLTLKQAFSVAALQQSVRTQSQQCDSCPMQQLHRLCERIEGLQPSKTKLELQRHLATLDNEAQAAVFENKMRAKSEQEENEMVMASLRSLYEEQQKGHQHSQPGESKQVSDDPNPAEVTQQQQSSSRQRLEEFKTRAKRSLTESLEGIWKASRKPAQRDISEGSDGCSSSSTITPEQGSLDEPLPPSSPIRPTSSLRGHNSTGDLKRLDPCSSPLSPSPGGTPQQQQQQQQQGFRRRASTYSHPPTPTSADPSPAHTDPLAPPDLTPGSKPKLVRHYSVSTDTPHQSNDVAALSSPGLMHVVGESPLRSQRHSWRQQIFLRVATPQKNSDSIERGEGGLEAYGGAEGGGAGGDPAPPGTPGGKRKSGEELRELWRKAILQQILLLRMETENQRLQASASDLQNKRLKQDYEEITPCLKDVTLVWERMLATPGRSKVKFDSDTIHAAVTQGVPRPQRGEIWKLLSEQYVLRQTVPARPPANQTPYKDLLKQLTSQQHAILIDLGRTFPTHPYFQAQLGAGQLSLYNLLKAYSLLDPEVGYCQGLSFIAGVLLLHLEEEQAFDMLKFLMYDMGLRKQYRPDMIILQIQMYQLSRLLHDYHRDLHSHLELHEIGPSLYATPWFLTVFASHFPLGFVARVFDMLFLQGSEVIFKVALSLLGSHKPLILQHDSLESIVDFIKTTLPNLGLVQMEKTINQVCQMDVSKQLQAYEVEYHVLQDELMDTPPTLSQSQRVAQLERTNQSLRQQNRDLLEELQVSQARVAGLEGRLEGLARSEGQLREQVCGLEEEARGLQGTVSRLHTLLTGLGVHTSAEGELIARPRSPDQQRPWAAGHPPGTEGLGKGTPDPLPEPLALPGGL